MRSELVTHLPGPKWKAGGLELELPIILHVYITTMPPTATLAAMWLKYVHSYCALVVESLTVFHTTQVTQELYRSVHCSPGQLKPILLRWAGTLLLDCIV